MEPKVNATARRTALPSRRNRRRRTSHARIRSAARLLFFERGVDATTIDEIVAEAEVSQKTFFNHFATKEVLLRELARTEVGHFERLLSDVCKENEALESRFEGFFLAVASEVETSRVLTRDLLHQIIRGASRVGVESEELKRVRAAFLNIVAEGRVRGDVDEEADLGFQADLVTGAFIGVILQWLNEPGYPLRDRMRQTAQFLGTALALNLERKREI